MKSLTLITALLLCSSSWISVSGSESQTVEVLPGQNVTLQCSNTSRAVTQMDWFRVVSGTKPSCVSSMFSSESKASPCPGFKNGKFEMTSNVSHVFLKIKQVDSSDSGLYFCGFYMKANAVISSATLLSVQDESDYEDKADLGPHEPGGLENLPIVILGCLTVFIAIVIVVLAVKVRNLQRGVNENAQPERNMDLDSDNLNYAALSFQAKPGRKHTKASPREAEPNVVYAATRAFAPRTGAAVSSC